MRKHKVVFYSPGTFMHEESSRDIEAWNPKVACDMAKSIDARHGAKPFGFRFKTFVTADPIPDGEGGVLEVVPKEIAKSGMYFITGIIFTLDDLRADGDEKLRILVGNMENNDLPLMVRNDNSYRIYQPFYEDDFVIDWEGGVHYRGDSEWYVRYRAAKKAEHEERLAAWRMEHVNG